MDFGTGAALPVSKPPLARQFNPYTSNGGTILALSGEDFSLVASDTRLSERFRIHTRDQPKTYKLTDNVVLGCCGFHGDVLTLNKLLAARIKMYKHQHDHEISCSSLAQMLSTILYSRRFFPFYTYNILIGLDEQGKGCVYSFDPVGSYERETYRAGGTGASMLQPLLDNQIGFKHQNIPEQDRPELTADRAIALVRDVFIGAAERDINTGDGLHMQLVTKDGIKTLDRFPLRKD
ncbi:Proteasome subunit beta type-1-B-like [Oopsacas minuta]|uniref:Proteasome subunit beta n=1 Tax=Oopsacas minuta TaxID=111878 RepID=A0AAV7KE05_9METZ|nr:Proteasome subunit beta type-1-B-like [Oopsacas minuta]